MVYREYVDLSKDKVPWVKIIGLSFVHLSDDNFVAIIKPFGNIIVPQDEVVDGRDASVVRVGILTHSRRWINDEVVVAAGGNSLMSGWWNLIITGPLSATAPQIETMTLNLPKKKTQMVYRILI